MIEVIIVVSAQQFSQQNHDKNRNKPNNKTQKADGPRHDIYQKQNM
jgi:hypothetical protein